ncbi:MAG: hypothetical protein ACOC5F_01815 [Candidatus Aminicenantaceae bacterium]
MNKLFSTLAISLLSALLVFVIFSCVNCKGGNSEAENVANAEVKKQTMGDMEITDAIEFDTDRRRCFF